MPKAKPAEVYSDLRVLFEEDLTFRSGEDTPNLQRTKHGTYVDRTVQAMWLGYKMANETHELVYRNVSPMTGRYIVGGVNETESMHSFRMAHSPYRHKARIAAQGEAARLSELHGGSFAIFRCVEVINSTPIETIECPA